MRTFKIVLLKKVDNLGGHEYNSTINYYFTWYSETAFKLKSIIQLWR